MKQTIKSVWEFVTFIMGPLGICLIGMPEPYFLLIIFVEIVYIGIKIISLINIGKKRKELKDRENYLISEVQKANSSDEKCKNIAEIIRNILGSSNSNREEYDKKGKKIKQQILVAVLAMVCVGVFNFNNIRSIAQKAYDTVQQFIEVLGEDSEKEPLEEPDKKKPEEPDKEKPEEPNKEKPEEPDKEVSGEYPKEPPEEEQEREPETTGEKKAAETPEKSVEEKEEAVLEGAKNSNKKDNDWVRFMLEEPESYSGFNNDEYKGLHESVFYDYEENLENTMQSEMAIWNNGCAVNMPLDEVVTSEDHDSGYFSKIEEGFSNEDGKLLSSNLLDVVIDGRKELLGLCPNSTLAWLLANDYQTYALNYQYQTNDARSISYFYMLSIFYVRESLKYEMSEDTRQKRIDYIRARYKDITDCYILDAEDRLRAYDILDAMESEEESVIGFWEHKIWQICSVEII